MGRKTKIIVDSTAEKIKDLTKEFQDILKEDDVKDFIFMAVRSDSESDGITLMTDAKKELAPADLISLAHVLAHLVSCKVGFKNQLKNDGDDIDDDLLRFYAQIILEFANEFITANVKELFDNDKLKRRFLRAMKKVDIEDDILHNATTNKCEKGCTCDDDDDEDDNIGLFKKFVDEH